MLFSIFITNYNRSNLILRALSSATQQTHSDFEVVIIDDGSTDNSQSVIQDFVEKSNKNITFIKSTTNQGKPACWNKALPHLNGIYTVPLDSDDELLPDALSHFDKSWSAIDDKTVFAAVEGLAWLNKKGVLSTNKYPTNPFITNWLSLAFRFNLWGGDCRRCYRTSVLKEYPFPLFPNEKDTMDSVITYRMSHEYNVLCFNQVVQIIHQQKQSLSTQGQRRRINSPNNFRLCCHELITIHSEYLGITEYLKTMMRFILFTFWSQYSNDKKVTNSIITQIREINHPSLYIILLPLAYIRFILEIIKYRFYDKIMKNLTFEK